MKWLFLLLVLLNLGIFGWYSVGASKFVVSNDPVYGPPTSQRILMSGEVPQLTDEEQSELDADLIGSLELELLALAKGEDSSSLSSAVEETELVAAPPEAKFCPIIYFEKEKEKVLLSNKVQAEGLQVKEYRMDDERQRYWIYISAPEKRQDAIAIVNTLKEKGIDSFIINRGEMKNRISLGLYSTARTANEEQVRIAGLSGFGVNVYEHMRRVPITVVEFLDSVSEKQWQRITSSLDLSKMMIKLEKKSC